MQLSFARTKTIYCKAQLVIIEVFIVKNFVKKLPELASLTFSIGWSISFETFKVNSYFKSRLEFIKKRQVSNQERWSYGCPYFLH